MKSVIKYGATGLVAFLIGMGAGSASGGAANSATPTAASTPLPAVTITQEVSVPSPPETVTETVEAPAPEAAPAPASSACDNAREALLTGGKADVIKALKALQADKSAPAVAREYAQYWLVRDAGNTDLQQMDASLIQTAC